MATGVREDLFIEFLEEDFEMFVELEQKTLCSWCAAPCSPHSRSCCASTQIRAGGGLSSTDTHECQWRMFWRPLALSLSPSLSLSLSPIVSHHTPVRCRLAERVPVGVQGGSGEGSDQGADAGVCRCRRRRLPHGQARLAC